MSKSKIIRGFLVFPLVVASAAAQSLSVGVKGGLIGNSDLSNPNVPSVAPESRRYIVGPSVEIGLTPFLRIEVDALYHRFGYREFNSDYVGDLTWGNVRANWWEVPILAKFRPARTVPLFASGGVAVRSISNATLHWNTIVFAYPTGQASYVSGSTPLSRSGSGSPYGDTTGLVAGGGAQFGRGRLLIMPEFRYVRWLASPSAGFGSGGGTQYVNSAQNQAEFLLGVSFGK